MFGEQIFKNVSIKDVPKRILVASFLVGTHNLCHSQPTTTATLVSASTNNEERVLRSRSDNEAEDDEDRKWEPRIYHNIPLRPGERDSTANICSGFIVIVALLCCLQIASHFPM
jgi:hypothetical protein